ncbi:MAG: HAD family hydrolase [wastewater metagenome]|nr:HAD family hydrolase [Candidatus Loosdrechtia aerotolerans]
MIDTSWHTLQTDEVIRSLDTNINTGLTETEVKNRINEYGYNQLEEKRKFSPITLFLEQFNSFIVWVLIGAAAVSGALRELDDALAIIAIVIINSIIGFIQEYRAEKSIAALQKMSAPFSKVLRNGEMNSIPSRKIVPGDIILLEAGDNIPADARLYSSFNLMTQEASLTGESTPVTKSTEPVQDPSLPVGDRENMVFMGTSVTNGKGTAIVVSTGMHTELGKIAGLIQEAGKEVTPLQLRLQAFGKKIVYLCLGIVTVVFLLEILRKGLEKDPLLEAFLISVSLAVAAIPEGLPAVVTIALALGVQRMVKRNVLIRKLPAVETLGCANVICTDKTGTLTQNEMTVKKIYTNGKTFDVSGIGYAPEGDFSYQSMPPSETDSEALKKTLEVAALCNNAHLIKEDNTWKIIGDPTEGALISAAAKADIFKETIEKEFPLISEIPFDSERKKMSTVRGLPSAFQVFEKGAPDVILKDCTKISINGEVRDLTDGDRRDILNENNKMTESALRVLGVAFKPIDHKPAKPISETVEKDMIFAGLLAMIDPPRPEVKESVATCRKACIMTVMITGDHKNTARAIGEELGILRKKLKAIDGMELNTLSDEALKEEVKKIAVYARVSPEHKLRIVRAWKKQGAVVSMTGDGVNDAPAVKEANIGISMGITGTDVTKEASDMIITDDNFASIVSAVEEGRGIYDNIKKTIHYLLSCNAGEILTMLFASVLNLPLPLFPIQILWMNIATDGLPALALGVDTVDPHIMEKPARRSTERIIDKSLGKLILLQGFLITVSTLLAYMFTLCDVGNIQPGNLFHWFTNELISGCFSGTFPGDLAKARTIAFSVMVISQLFQSFNCRNATRSLFEVGVFTNKKLILAAFFSLILQISIIYIPYTNGIFKVVTLELQDWIVIFGFSSLTFFVMEIIKYFIRRTEIPRGIEAVEITKTAVREVRPLYDIVKKPVHYLLSCNFGEILATLFAFIFRFPIPLSPLQIVWTSTVTDILPALALGADTIDPSTVHRVTGRSEKQFLTKSFITLILVQGFLIALSTLLAYFFILYGGSAIFLTLYDNWFTDRVIPYELQGDITHARTIAFSVMVIAQLFHSFNCRSVWYSVFTIGVFTNKLLLLATMFSLALHVAILYTSYTRDIFHVIPLGFYDWIIVFGFSSLTLIVMEIIKSLTRRE